MKVSRKSSNKCHPSQHVGMYDTEAEAKVQGFKGLNDSKHLALLKAENKVCPSLLWPYYLDVPPTLIFPQRFTNEQRQAIRDVLKTVSSSKFKEVAEQLCKENTSFSALRDILGERRLRKKVRVCDKCCVNMRVYRVHDFVTMNGFYNHSKIKSSMLTMSRSNKACESGQIADL